MARFTHKKSDHQLHRSQQAKQAQSAKLMNEPAAMDASEAASRAQNKIEPRALSAEQMIALQRTVGNQALQRMIQTQLTVNAPGDAYEQEADRVAEQVVAMPAPTQTAVQRETEDGEDQLHAKPLADTISRMIQREGTPDEEEALQRDTAPTEEEAAQLKPLAGHVQRHWVPGEPEEALQTKPALARTSLAEGGEVGGNIENRLQATQSGGSPLAAETRDFMETRFGADFSGVRVHTGGTSEQLNRSLSAQAFTHGGDIYFGEGRYNPGATEGKRLLAHELTHVVQQGASKPMTQRKLQGRPSFETMRDRPLQRANPFAYRAIQRWDKATPTKEAKKEGDTAPQLGAARDPKVIAEEQAKKDYKAFVAGGPYKFLKFVTDNKFGKFDVVYEPANNLANINMNLKFRFPDDSPGGFLGLFGRKAREERHKKYITNFMSQVTNQWSGRYQFKNVREPQTVWSQLSPVSIKLNVKQVEADEHFLVNVNQNTAGTANVNNKGVTTLFKGDDVPQPAFNPGTAQNEVKRVNKLAPNPVLFANNSSDVQAGDKNKLQFLGDYLRRINNPKFDVDIVGHASATGKKELNQGLSEKRAQAVADLLGVKNHNLKVSGVGQTGAGADAGWRKVDITPSIDPNWKNFQDVTAHEFGHMIGLDDEYNSGRGAVTDHYALVKKAFGQQYADAVALVDTKGPTDSASIMEGGNDVRIQHYVTFWDAFVQTAQKAPAPVPAFTHDDWKFIG